LHSAVESRIRELETQLGREAVESGNVEDAVLDNFHLVGDPPAKAVAFYVSKLIDIQLHFLPEPIVHDYAHALLKTNSEFQRKHEREIKRLVRERLLAQTGHGEVPGEKAPVEGETQHTKQIILTPITGPGKTEPMQSGLDGLRRRLRTATQGKGKKTELAKFLGVKPPRISEWLSDREPGGETTLRLLQWVEREEAKQKSPASVDALEGAKTRLRKSQHDNQKPSREKD
jgi:hypothetical protein